MSQRDEHEGGAVGGHVRNKSLVTSAVFVAVMAGTTASASPSIQIFTDLGIKDGGAALEALYHSGTLTKESLWANIKRAKIEKPEEIWLHQVTVLQEKMAKGEFDKAAEIFFGGSLGLGDQSAGHELILSPMDAKRLLIAQAQEVFGRKEGQRHDAFGVPADSVVDEEHMNSALTKLGLIDTINPPADANVIVVPGASIVGLIAREIYVADMTRQGIIKPSKIVITAGDRVLTEGLDSLGVAKISEVGNALDVGKDFGEIAKILLAPDVRDKAEIFSELQKTISADYNARQEVYHARIKGFEDWSKFSPLNETGAAIYLLETLGLGGNWEVTHTPQYADGRRPDTDSTAATFAKYYFDNLYSPEGPNKINVAANQPYSERQAEAYKRAIAEEADSRSIDHTFYEITFCGFAYNHGGAKRPLSEFAALVAEKAKGDASIDLAGLMFRGREVISIDDMPSLGDMPAVADDI